jgi:hypothetical protein
MVPISYFFCKNFRSRNGIAYCIRKTIGNETFFVVDFGKMPHLMAGATGQRENRLD